MIKPILPVVLGMVFISSLLSVQVSGEALTETPVPVLLQEAGDGEKKDAPLSPFGFAATVGTEVIDGVSYMSVGLQPEFVLGKFGAGLDITFRMDGSFRLYEPDWDHWSDAIGKINYIRWGQKRDKLFFKIGLLDEVYLGHGSIFYRFSNKLFLPEVRRIGLQFDMDFKAFGWELFDDDIIDNRIFGGRVYFRPFHESKVFFLQKLALGLSGAADIALSTNSAAPYVALAGVDLDIPVLQIPHILDLILFADVVKNTHFHGTDGVGITPGFLLEIFKFRFTGEYRYYQPKFAGPYFDAFYDLERDAKLASLSGLTNVRHGWSVKMARDILGWVSFAFDLGGERGENPSMHFEAVMLRKLMDKVQAGMAYDKRDISSFRDTFDLTSVNAILSAYVVYAVSPNVDIRVNYERAFKEAEDGTVSPVVNFGLETKIHF